MGKAAFSPVHSSIKWAYRDDLPKYPLDLERANKLLDGAGYPKKADGTRFRLSIRYDRGVALFSKTAEILREQLRPVGIDLVLTPGDRATTIDMVYKQRKFDIFIAGITAGGDPAVRLSSQYRADNVRPVPWSNASGYKNLEVDNLLDKDSGEVDRQKRAKIYYEIQQIMAKDLPAIWIEEYGSSSGWRGEFKGLHDWSSMSAYTLEGVWWTKGKSK